MVTMMNILLILFLAWSATLTGPSSAADQTPGVTLIRVPGGGIQPQVSVDSRGLVHIIYFQGEPAHGNVFYVRSRDGGETFSTPRLSAETES